MEDTLTPVENGGGKEAMTGKEISRMLRLNDS
jgi:hypothetical protein